MRKTLGPPWYTNDSALIAPSNPLGARNPRGKAWESMSLSKTWETYVSQSTSTRVQRSVTKTQSYPVFPKYPQLVAIVFLSESNVSSTVLILLVDQNIQNPQRDPKAERAAPLKWSDLQDKCLGLGVWVILLGTFWRNETKDYEDDMIPAARHEDHVWITSTKYFHRKSSSTSKLHHKSSRVYKDTYSQGYLL